MRYIQNLHNTCRAKEFFSFSSLYVDEKSWYKKNENSETKFKRKIREKKILRARIKRKQHNNKKSNLRKCKKKRTLKENLYIANMLWTKKSRKHNIRCKVDESNKKNTFNQHRLQYNIFAYIAVTSTLDFNISKTEFFSAFNFIYSEVFNSQPMLVSCIGNPLKLLFILYIFFLFLYSLQFLCAV